MIPREVIKASEWFFMQNIRGKKGAESKVLVYFLCPTLFSHTFATDCYQKQGFGLDRNLCDSVAVLIF